MEIQDFIRPNESHYSSSRLPSQLRSTYFQTDPKWEFQRERKLLKPKWVTTKTWFLKMKKWKEEQEKSASGFHKKSNEELAAAEKKEKKNRWEHRVAPRSPVCMRVCVCLWEPKMERKMKKRENAHRFFLHQTRRRWELFHLFQSVISRKEDVEREKKMKRKEI